MSLNTGVMFSKASDAWETPQAFFDRLNAEFQFDIDAAASAETHKCRVWYGGQIDALALESWATVPSSIWLNPPYSSCRAFVAKAAAEAHKGHTVVVLVPSRTDTRWWHQHVYDATACAWRPGVEVRFVPGRLKFGGSTNSAPFPSVVIIFRPLSDGPRDR
jgi:site-specific DNA-methyltransferase (adenine-specific)